MRTTIMVPVGRATYDEYDTPEGWRNAIRAGDLKRDTIVTVYRGDDPAVSVPARQVRELDDLFDELLGAVVRKPHKKATLPKPPSAVPTPDPAIDASGPEALAGEGRRVDLPEEARTVPPSKSSSPPAPVEVVRLKPTGPSGSGAEQDRAGTPPTLVDPPPIATRPPATATENAAVRPFDPARTKKTGTHWVWILVCVILLLLMGRCISDLNIGPEQSGSDTLVTAYAVRDLNVRRAASRSSDIAGELDRATQVQGRWIESEGERWLQIVDGPNEGAYIWAGNLGNDQPPLLRGEARVLEVRQASAVRAGPDENAALLQTVVEGQSLNTLGRTETGWIEVTMSGTGVGYVRETAFIVAPRLQEPVVASDETAATPVRPSVCRTLREGSGDQRYCRTGEGPWVAEGAPSPVRAPTPTPSRPINLPTTAPETLPSLSEASRTSPITRPRWLEQPDGGTFARFIPQRALERGQSGRVSLDCAVNVSGRLENCRISSETPTGWGFGAAALRVPPYFRMAATDLDGQPTSGRRVRFAVSFAFEDE